MGYDFLDLEFAHVFAYGRKVSNSNLDWIGLNWFGFVRIGSVCSDAQGSSLFRLSSSPSLKLYSCYHDLPWVPTSVVMRLCLVRK